MPLKDPFTHLINLGKRVAHHKQHVCNIYDHISRHVTIYHHSNNDTLVAVKAHVNFRKKNLHSSDVYMYAHIYLLL